MATIGFIGLGNMGLPMAQNLLKAGHKVQGFDVSKAQMDALAASGGTAAASVKAAASGAEVVITMLPAGQHVRDVYTRRRRRAVGRGEQRAADRLLDHRCRDRARGCGGGREKGPADAGRAGVRWRRRCAGRHADLHGRRQRRGVRARQADPGEDGQDHRACRRRGQRPGGEDLQQHDPRRVDDRGVGSLRAGREARARRAEAVRHLLEVVGPVLVDDDLLPGAWSGADVAGQPRLHRRASPRR